MNKHDLEIKDGPHRLETTTAEGDYTFSTGGHISHNGEIVSNGVIHHSGGIPQTSVTGTLDFSKTSDHTSAWVTAEAQTLHAAWQGTCAINQTAGNVSNAGWKAADHQIKIIESEFNELKEGIAARDEKELRDGIADVLFTVIGLVHRAGLPSIDDLAEVVRSNLTKFDTSVEDAEKTRVKYEKISVQTYYKMVTQADGQILYVTYSAFDQQDTQGKSYIAHKWLKSYRWEDVRLAPLASDNQLQYTV